MAVSEKTKTCAKCKTVKPFSEFYAGYSKTSRSSYCVECTRKKNLTNRLRKLGLSPDDYFSMLNAQGSVCAICSEPETGGDYLAVDHCHATGRVRALLCRRCNVLLGMARDNVDLLEKAKAYLIRF